MLSRRLLAGLVCIVAGTAQGFAQTASCNFTTFSTPSQYAGTFVTGINNYDNVVGTICGNEDPNGCYNDRGYIRYSNGTSKVLLAPNSTDTQFSKRNASGVTVGQMTDAKGTHGVVYYNGTWRTVNFPGATSTSLSGINKYGTLVGTYYDSTGHGHGFKLKNGTFTKLNYPGATDTYATSISDTGTVVGWYWTPNAAVNTHGFIVQNGVMKTLDYPYGYPTTLTDINAKGEILGDADGSPFIYKGGKFYDVWIQGANAVSEGGINGNGQISGTVYFGLPTTGFIGTCTLP